MQGKIPHLFLYFLFGKETENETQFQTERTPWSFALLHLPGKLASQDFQKFFSVHLLHSILPEIHIRYYEDYIQSQVRGGRSEQEVLQELGDPHLIAKTLIDTDDGSTQEDYG